MAMYVPVLMDCALITSLKVPSPTRPKLLYLCIWRSARGKPGESNVHLAYLRRSICRCSVRRRWGGFGLRQQQKWAAAVTIWKKKNKLSDGRAPS